MLHEVIIQGMCRRYFSKHQFLEEKTALIQKVGAGKGCFIEWSMMLERVDMQDLGLRIFC
ncbi:MAG: hypothetical protein JWM16_6058, partial [Verrucomicrobiales bacterium]|nr:hypothetical protein [Verrucomicrobiales bacterium]